MTSSERIFFSLFVFWGAALASSLAATTETSNHGVTNGNGDFITFNDDPLRDEKATTQTSNPGITNGNGDFISIQGDPSQDEQLQRAANCKIEAYNGIFYWTSPNFGVSDYPNNAYCSSGSGTSSPTTTVLTFQPMDLVEDDCNDYVEFTLPYGMITKYCGIKTGQSVTIPTFQLSWKFFSDSSLTSTGFNISLDTVRNDCTKKINLNSIGDNGIIKVGKKDKICEFWIYAPEGNHVQLEFKKFKLKKCKNYVVINPEGDKKYPVATSSFYCGKNKPPTITSVDNEIALVYQNVKKSKGFKLKYTVVA